MCRVVTVLALASIVPGCSPLASGSSSAAFQSPAPSNIGIQSQLSLASADAPACSAEFMDRWDSLTTHHLGVAALDPDGFWIPGYAAIKFWFILGRNWYPIHPQKQTFCGTQHHAAWYSLDPPWLFSEITGSENDWNIFLRPTGPSVGMFEDAKAFVTKPGGAHDCNASDDCMEAETTTDERFFENPYYPRPAASRDIESPFNDSLVCVYGPWVSEEAHDHRPEIHPAEMVWSGSAENGMDLLVLKDDSDRFDGHRKYKRIKGTPTDPAWRPWSAPPRAAEFRVAFEVGLDGAVVEEHVVTEVDAANVVTPQYLEETSDSVQSIRYDGKEVFRVRNRAPVGNVSLGFADVCRAGSALRGLVSIRTVIDMDEDVSGYHALRYAPVTGAGPRLLAAARQEPTGQDVAVQLTPIVSSLRRVGSANAASLVADVSVRVHVDSARTGAGALSQPLALSAPQMPSARLTDQEVTGPTEVSAVIRDVPILDGGEVLLVTRPADTVRLVLPRLRLIARAVHERPTLTTVADEAWRNMTRALDAPFPDRGTPPGQVMRADRWVIRTIPAYVPEREGEPEPAGVSAFGAALSQAIETGDREQLRRYFGTPEPYSARWSFSFTDRTADSSITSRFGELAASNEALVRFQRKLVDRAAADLRFPQGRPEHLYRATASVVVRDVYGNEATADHTVWSLVVSGDTERGLADATIPSLAALVGVEPQRLEAASSLQRPADPWAAETLEQRRGRMLRLLAIRSADDRLLTVDELQALINGTRMFPRPQ